VIHNKEKTMQRDWKRSVRAGMFLASYALLAAQSARAVGTASGTSVDNRATVAYSVGSTSQPLIESSPTGNSVAGAGNGTDTSFLVDNMVDLTVSELSGSYTSVASGGVSEVLVYTVANTGNTTQDFSLTAADNATDPFGGTDNFDATPVAIFVDANNNSVYDAGIDIATYIDELGADADVEVFVLRDMGVRANGDISAVTLTARVAAGGVGGTQGADILTDDSAAADLPGTVQIAFADAAGDTDAANDGQYSDTGAYRVGAAAITVAKTSLVISDPIGGPNPKAIPGAVVEYTVTVTNAVGASAAATNVQVSDSLNAEITALTLAFDANGYGAGTGIRVTAPNINGGAPLALTNTNGDSDGGDFTGNAVTASGITLQAGESATVTFRVVIQ
jgi:uncharacterized repeat protein (TIGR01451 family)